MPFSLPISLPLAEQWMAQAYELARGAELKDEVPVGAIFVCEGEIIGIGANAREKTKRVISHAEIVALEDYNRRSQQWRLPPGTSLFVTAEPCLMCTGALLAARLERVFYGCHDPKKAGMERISSLIHAGTFDHRFSEVKGGILGERCSRLLSNYFRRKREDNKAVSAPPLTKSGGA